MIKVGITGQNGFIAEHLRNNLGLYTEEFEIIDFKRVFFDQPESMDNFVEKCDVIFHLAAVNRHNDLENLYKKNKELTEKLVSALERTGSVSQVLFSSSLQEEGDIIGNFYGRAKKECREILAAWAKRTGGKFIGLVIPNVFGPFSKPFYNSFVATFCHLLTKSEQPQIHQDNQVELIYVQDLIEIMIDYVRGHVYREKIIIQGTVKKKVSEVLDLLIKYRDIYFEEGNIPHFSDAFEKNLFNTFRSYIDFKTFFPREYTLHLDERGEFVELIRLGTGGQVSFSTTLPGIVRGNHFHTRKIERFSVIKGKALIEMRKIGDDEVLSFEINGNQPGFVDMPVWYTHNIKNIGDDTLYTVFWINEQFNPEDTDTFFAEI